VAACDTPLQHDLYSVLSAPKAYTIILSAGTGGKVSAATTKENYSESSVLTIKAGKEETIGITAKSDAGYSFTAWAIEEGTASVVDCASSSTSLTTQASSAKITASFTPDHYQLSLTAGDHGSIKAPTTGNGSVSVVLNAKTVITATPDSGYLFAGWSAIAGAGNATIADPSSATTTVALTGPATLKASFTNLTHTLTVLAAAGGSIQTPSTGSEVVAETTPVPIVAVPDTGYVFSGWTVTSGAEKATIGNAASASTTISLTGDATIRANFSLINWTPSAFAITNGDGTTALGLPDNAFNSSTGALAFTVSASLHPGQSIQDTRIIETALTAQGAASGTPIVTDLHTYSSAAMPYTLKTTGQGYKLLQVQVEDNNNQWSTILGAADNLYGAVVNGQTVCDTYRILYDTTPAVVSNLSLNSGSAYAKSGAISLGFVSSKGAAPAAVLTGYMIKDSTGTPTTPGIGDAGWTSLPGNATSFTGTSIPYTIAGFGDSVSSNVYVYVKDEAGNIGSTHAAIIGDSTPPSLNGTVTAASTGSLGFVRNGQAVSIGFTMLEAGSGIGAGSPSVTIGGRSATVSGSYPGYTATLTIGAGEAALAEGNLPYTIDAADKAGNSMAKVNGSTGIVYDRTAPAFTVGTITSSGASGYAKTGDTITLPFTATETGTGIAGTPSATIDGQPATVTGSYPSYSASYKFTGSEPETSAGYVINGADKAGNAGASSGSTNITYDHTAPTLTLNTFSSNSSTNPAYAKIGDIIKLNFTASDTNLNVVRGSIASKTATIANTTGNNYTATWTVVSGDAQGTTSYSVTVTDKAGNSTTLSSGATGAVTIDTVAPNAPTITVQPPTMTNTTFGLTVNGSTDPGGANASGFSHYTITSGVAGAPVTSTTGTFMGLTAAAQGNNTLTIVAYDVAGNVSSSVSPASPVFSDNVPPNAPTITVQPPTVTNTTFGLTVSSTDPGGAAASGISHYAITSGVTGVPITSTTGTFSGLTAAAQGNNTLTIVAYDVAGNVSTSVSPTSPVFYDNVSPNAPTITVQPPTVINTTFGLTVSSTDPGGAAASGISHYAITSGVTGVPVTSTTGTFAGLTAAAQGNNTLTIIAYDVAGNVSTAVSPASPVFYDNVPPNAPTITVQPPTMTNTTFGLTVNGSTDPGGANASGFSHYTITSGVTGVPVTSTTGTFSGLTAAAQGNNTLTIVAYDVAGNVSTSVSPTSPVFYDNVPPSAPTIAVQPPTMTNTTFGFTVGSTDPGGAAASGISHYAITSGVTGAPVTSTTGTFAGLTAAAQGTNTLTIVAYDVAGNVSSSVSPASPVFYDNVPPNAPTITVQPPAMTNTTFGLTVNGSTDPGGANASGFSHYTITSGVTGAPVTSTTGTFSGLTAAAQGNNTLTIVAYDVAGNVSTSVSPASPVFYDNVPPTAPTITGQPPTMTNTTFGLTVNGSTDPGGANASGFSHYAITSGVTGAPVTSTTGTFTGLTAAAQGNNTLTIVAYDVAGNVSTAVSPTSPVFYDNVPPNAPTITMQPPAMTNTTFGFTVGSTDPGGATASGISHYTITSGIAGAPVTSPTGIFAGLTAASQGNNTLTIVAYDAAGNVSTSVSPASPVFFDNVPPTAPSITVQPPTMTNTTFGLTVNGSTDPGGAAASGISHYAITSGVTGVPVTSTTGTFAGLTAAAQGNNVLTIVAYDVAGNVSSSVSPASPVFYDNVSPTISGVSFTSPHGLYAGPSDAVTLSYTAQDNSGGSGISGAPMVEIRVNGGLGTGTVSQTGYNSTYSATYSMGGGDSDGPITYTIYVIDFAGNTATPYSGGGITYDKTPPAEVTGYSASTGSTNGDVLLYWTEPVESDYKQLDISWTGSSSGSTTVAAGTPSNPYTLSGLVSSGIYNFTLATEDFAGNISVGVSLTNITARSLFASSSTSLTTAARSRNPLYSTSSRPSFPTPVFTDTPSAYSQIPSSRIPAASKRSPDLAMEPISLRSAPAVAPARSGPSIDSSGLSIIQRSLKAAAAMATGATVAATQNENAIHAPVQNVRYSVPKTTSEASATETTDVRPLPVSASENAVPALNARATAAVAVPLSRSQKNPAPKGDTMPRPDFCLGESKKERDAGEESFEDET